MKIHKTAHTALRFSRINRETRFFPQILPHKNIPGPSAFYRKKRMKNAEDKAWIAKIAGSSYFLLLGIAYAALEAVSGHFSFADAGVLLWSAIPIIINKRWMHLLFGGLNLLVWSYVAIAILVKGSGNALTLVAVSSLDVLSIVSALLLVYAAVNISEQRFSLI